MQLRLLPRQSDKPGGVHAAHVPRLFFESTFFVDTFLINEWSYDYPSHHTF
jgi:hypothetical protein